jgi:cytosine/adenosine deaminase-related metal-dependent hydrolase
MRQCVDLAVRSGCLIHTHLAETKVQSVLALERWRQSVVSYLSSVGALNAEFVGAHAIWINESDIDALASAGATVVHNPASNLKLSSGVCPVRELSTAGVTIALGTDGVMTSDNLEMHEAMRLAALLGKARFPYDETLWTTAPEVWGMATDGGARGIGWENLGRLEEGYLADFVLLRRDSAYQAVTFDPIRALTYSETGASVDTVVVDGQVIVRNGTATKVDASTIRRRAQETAVLLHEDGRSGLAAGRDLYQSAVRDRCRQLAARELGFDRWL